MSKYINYLSNINTGYKRIWYLSTIIWLIFSTYYFGYYMYSNPSKNDYERCWYSESLTFPYNSKIKKPPVLYASTQLAMFPDVIPQRYFYSSYSDVPFIKRYYCTSELVTIYKDPYVKLTRRYITIGRVALIVFPPFFIPFLYILYRWIKEGFEHDH